MPKKQCPLTGSTMISIPQKQFQRLIKSGKIEKVKIKRKKHDGGNLKRVIYYYREAGLASAQAFLLKEQNTYFRYHDVDFYELDRIADDIREQLND